MADISLQQLAAQLPAGSIVQDGTDVVISLKAVTGENALALADEKTAESFAKLLMGAAKAQTTYNTANPNAQLSTFSSASFGIPTLESNGMYYADASFNVTVSVPLTVNEIVGNSL
jgi:hypothetical protein